MAMSETMTNRDEKPAGAIQEKSNAIILALIVILTLMAGLYLTGIMRISLGGESPN